MSALTGKTRTAFLLFFSSHIPITFLIDGQALLPSYLYPSLARSALKFYTDTFQDPLMTSPHPVWFRSMVACEMLFQVPFFFAACHALYSYDATKNSVDGKGWFRSACIAYGAHTSTTLIPILAQILVDESLDLQQKGVLFGFYLPYLVFPAWLLIIGLCNENVFGDDSQQKDKNKKA